MVPTERFKQMVAFGREASECKRQAALLHAASQSEKEFPVLITMCVGIGPEEELNKIKAVCGKFELKNTFLLVARG